MLKNTLNEAYTNVLNFHLILMNIVYYLSIHITQSNDEINCILTTKYANGLTGDGKWLEMGYNRDLIVHLCSTSTIWVHITSGWFRSSCDKCVHVQWAILHGCRVFYVHTSIKSNKIHVIFQIYRM